MKIHWYWPYSFGSGRTPLADATFRPDDVPTVQALASRFGQALPTNGPYEVVRDLPETNDGPRPTSKISRVVSRAPIYTQRAIARRRLVRSRNFDVSVLHHLNHYIDAATLRDLSRMVPLVSFVHDVWPHEPRLPPTIERRLLSKTYRSAGHLVVYHRVLRESLIADFGIDASRVHTIRIPLGLRTPPEQSDIERPSRFLFFGTFRPNKGLPVLLDAIELLGPRADFTLHIAGRGQESIVNQVRQLAERFPNVTCEFGFISHERMEELFSRNDMVVLPYTSFASQSGVLADAYSFGLPLIVTDVGAIGPTVREDGSGLVVKPGSAEDLATALDKAARLETLRDELRYAVLRTAKLHSYDNVGADLRDILSTAATERKDGAA